MITLYHSPQSRSSSIVWLLDELQVPYETQAVTFRRADGTGQVDPANPHPHGKVPALKDGDDTLFESGAIALYLTDKYRKVKMGPAVGEPKRGEYLSWLFYRPGIMEPAFIERRFNIQHVNGAMGWAAPDEVDKVLNDHVAKNKYWLGDEFSALDIMVGGGLYYMMMFKMTPETDVLKEYTSRIIARPAFQKAMQK
ncbi:MAG TPA: glutathione S-transferase family protein [Rhizomicrobium sp.]|nr:glutathione S-transferase family protein [Rhizomicrobium sp.]